MDPTKRRKDYSKEIVELALDAAEEETEVSRDAFVTSRRWPHIAAARHCFFWHALSMMNNYRERYKLTAMELSPAMIADRAGYERTTLLHGAARWAEDTGLPNPTQYRLKAKRDANDRWQAKQGTTNV